MFGLVFSCGVSSAVQLRSASFFTQHTSIVVPGDGPQVFQGAFRGKRQAVHMCGRIACTT